MKKLFKFVLRLFIFILMVFYVYIGAVSAVTLVKIEKNRRQPVGYLSAVINNAVETSRSHDAAAWVRFRPLAETEALIGMIVPDSGALGSDMFFELSRRQLQQGHLEDALFWLQLGRYRLRYDTLRCGTYDPEETLDTLLDIFVSREIQDLLQQYPGLIKKSIQQVLDFDAKHPARNNPSLICSIVNKITKSGAPPQHEEQWEDIRLTLRQVTESSLKKMDSK